MRYPDRKIKFYNAGKGGDTAQTSIDGLERDVFAHNATVMLVALGVNDIGWGMKADAEHKNSISTGFGLLIEKCKEKNVRVIVCSPAITAENPETSEKGFLQTWRTRASLKQNRRFGTRSIYYAACVKFNARFGNSTPVKLTSRNT